jgi:hypothetical protein
MIVRHDQQFIQWHIQYTHYALCQVWSNCDMERGFDWFVLITSQNRRSEHCDLTGD